MGRLALQIRHLNPCKEAVAWLDDYGSWEHAWSSCERGDWMFWLLGKLSGLPDSESRKQLVLCACKCARTALKYVPSDEERPRKAIEITESWARGEGQTLEGVRWAAADAEAAAYVASVDADYTTYFSVSAAHGAAMTAFSADAAYHAAETTTDAATACSTICSVTLKDYADIVREDYPEPPLSA